MPGVRPKTLSLLLSPPGSDDERAALAEEEVTAEEDAQMAAASTVSAGSLDTLGPELQRLDEMARIAAQARYEPDSRVRHLIAWIKDNLCPNLGARGARWNNRRVLIFTEYTDTKRYLVQQLQAIIAGSDLATWMLYPSDVEATSLDRIAIRPLSSAAGSEGSGFRAWVEGCGSFSGIWPSLAGYPAGHGTSSGIADDGEESTKHWPLDDFQALDLED